MSISKKIYKSILKTKEITSSKLFKNSLIFFMAIFLAFGTLNAYAVEEDLTIKQNPVLTVSPAWKETKWLHNLASGLLGIDKDQDNMNSRQGTEVLNTGWTLLTLMAPEITDVSTSGSADLLPYDLRRGLLGMADDAGTAIYAQYPIVNVGEHLAQQWVPGYKETSTALYAADTGYQVLSNTGIDTIWVRVLNVSYIFFVLVMIVAGFMIMFRHKIGGQAMVTLGSVLPKVIISLILATFSFAIAGLIIDLGGVIVSILAFILSGGGELSSIGGIAGLFATVFGQNNQDTGWIIKAVVSTFGLSGILQNLTPDSPLGIIALVFFVFQITVNPLLRVQVGVIAIILILVILGIIFVGAVKVLITLFKAYFSLLLTVIIGPLQITLGAIPGNSHMISNWLLSVLRNVLVFPVVFFIINIPNALGKEIDEINMAFPSRLIYDQGATGDLIVNGTLFVAILRIFVLYFAAQAPKLISGVLPSSQPKGVQEGIAAAKANLTKIPLIGSMFK